jgi:hypothetical protein
MKTLILSTLIALVTAVGCVQPVAAPVSVETVSFGQDVDPTFCQVVFTPDASTLEETTLVAARWAQATGCDIRVGAGGITVVTATEILDPEGKTRQGVTNETDGVTTIRVIAVRRPVVLVHEMGHALAGNGHIDDELDGVLQRHGKGNLITAADLEFVCETLNCQTFTPEA